MDGNDSIKNYCRICALNSPDVRNIFEVVYKEKPLSDILGQCLQCTIHRTECFPEYICSQCCADLLTMHKFIANYEKSEKWFISRYEALNDARIIKTETVCPTQFEKTFDTSVEPNHQIFVESVINAIPIQDQTPNPLQVKEEFDHDYELRMDDLPPSPNESALENQELNKGNYNNVQENLAAPYCNGINEVRKVTQDKKTIGCAIETRKYQCSVCPKQFSSVYRLRNHEHLHTGKITFECYFCDEIFRRNDYRVNHIRKVHPDVAFECYTCKLTFNTHNKMRLHMRNHDHRTLSQNETNAVLAKQLMSHRVVHSREQHESVASHQCPFCSKVFTQRSSLNTHVDRHRGRLYKCKYCELMLTSRSARRYHQRNIHEARKSCECFDCKRVFQHLSDLMRHMKIHSSNGRVVFECEICYKPFWSESQFICHKRKHNERIFNCEYCNESFENRFDLNSHVREIHAEKIEQHQCDQCSKRFPLKSSLKTHIYRYHTGRELENHICTECGRKFQKYSYLTLHLKTHSDERPISCSHCPSKFKNKLQLKSHMAVHSTERTFICQVVVDGKRVCGKTFQFVTALRAHKKTHDPSNKSFACLSCPAKFFNKRTLEIHTRIHTGERPFKCDHCDKAYTQKCDMTRHMLIHLGRTPHNCSECNASFRLVTELRKHSYSHFKPSEN